MTRHLDRIDRTGVIVTCPSCGKANRLAFATLDRTTRCGQCKTTLSAPSSPIEVTDTEAFDAAAAGSVLPLVVDFWAPWCGPCRMVAPELERVASQAAGRFLVLKVDTDRLTDLAARYRISSIPTLAIVHGGRELDRFAGAKPAAEILAFAERTAPAGARRAS